MSAFQVDQRLQTKVYLVGLSVSLADLVLFTTLYRALVSLDNLQGNAEHAATLACIMQECGTMCRQWPYLQANIPSAQIIDRYPSLFRWFDFLQHTVDPAGLYKRVDIRKPKFQRAPAPPPPVAKVSQDPHWPVCCML